MSNPLPNSRVPLGDRARAVPWLGWLYGIGSAFYVMALSGFDRVLGGPGDARLVNFTLEHGYRWLMRDPMHADFWSPPIFFPHVNVGAYSDVLLGTGFFYWIWRWLGLDPSSSFQLWMVTCWSLNFLVIYLLLRRYARAGRGAATVASVVYAFGSARMANAAHPQLIPHFYVVLALVALLEVFRTHAEPSDAKRQQLAIALFWACLVLQAYTAMYTFLFTVMTLALALVLALARGRWRTLVRARLRRYWKAMLAASTFAGLLLWPLASHYLAAAREVGYFGYNPTLLPRIASWLLMSPDNLLFGWLQDGGPFSHLSRSPHSNGVGFVTLGLSFIGLLRARGRPLVQFLLVSTIGMVLLTTMWPGDLSLWRLVREAVPGTKGLRAVGRVGMVLLIPAAVGLSLFFERLRTRRHALLAAGLMALCLLEQLHVVRLSYDKIALQEYIDAIALEVPGDCEAFYLVSTGGGPYRRAHDEAAWVALKTKTPTINGRYGHFPPDYGALQDPNARSLAGIQRLRRELDRWLEDHGDNSTKSCIVEVPRHRTMAAYANIE